MSIQAVDAVSLPNIKVSIPVAAVKIAINTYLHHIYIRFINMWTCVRVIYYNEAPNQHLIINCNRNNYTSSTFKKEIVLCIVCSQRMQFIFSFYWYLKIFFYVVY